MFSNYATLIHFVVINTRSFQGSLLEEKDLPEGTWGRGGPAAPREVVRNLLGLEVGDASLPYLWEALSWGKGLTVYDMEAVQREHEVAKEKAQEWAQEWRAKGEIIARRHEAEAEKIRLRMEAYLQEDLEIRKDRNFRGSWSYRVTEPEKYAARARREMEEELAMAAEYRK